MSKLDSILDKIKAKHADAFENVNDKGIIKGFSLDSPQLNFLFGGKFPTGRIIEFFGPESSGKSSTANFLAAQTQKHNIERPIVVYIDFERTFSRDYAVEMGVDVDDDKFIFLQPLTGEEAFQICKELIESLPIGLIVWDSIGATPSASQMEDAFKATYGGTANVLASGLKMLNPYLSKYDTSLLFINQERALIGGFSPVPGATNTPGGFARKFYASSRNRITRIETLKQNGESVGIKMKVRNVKSKVGCPGREAILDLYWDHGIDSDSEYMSFILDLLCTKEGQSYCNSSWLMIDQKTGELVPMKIRGRDNTIAFLNDYFKEHPEDYEKAKRDVNALICGQTILDKEVSGLSEEELEKPTEEEKNWAAVYSTEDEE